MGPREGDPYPQNAERIALVRAMDSYDGNPAAIRAMTKLSRMWLRTLPMPGRKQNLTPKHAPK